jgi:hypothetical protein
MHRCLFLSIFLFGCVPPVEAEPGTDGPRPDDSPDYVILAASGHCLTNCPSFPRENLVGQGTAQLIADLLGGYGLSSATFDYADSFFNHLSDGTAALPSPDAPAVEFGFLQMVADLADIRDRWIRDFQDPTRVIVLGHSHGVVWTHTLVRLRPDVSIDFLIDLDGDSTGWEDDGDQLVEGDGWSELIRVWSEAEGVIWDFPIENAVDVWQVAGIDALQDIEDVVPESVAWNLEVHGDSFALRDEDVNHRFDGSDLGIIVGQASEEHDTLDDPGSESMAWVLDRMTEIFDGP